MEPRNAASNGLSYHEFDKLFPPRRRRVELRRGRREDIEPAVAMAANSISGSLAARDVVERVLGRNANNILVFWQRGQLVGTWSMLMLNSAGLEAMLTGGLTATCPLTRYLSMPTEAPAAIYVWAVVAPGLASEGIRHVSAFLRQPLYAEANLFARPATEAGRRLSEALGFRKVPLGRIQGDDGGLYRYERLINQQMYIDLAA